MAAMTKSYEAVNVLLSAGADTNTVDSAGCTALVYALMSKDNTAIIDRLCGLTINIEGREKAFRMIAEERINMSGPLQIFIIDSLRNTGRQNFRKEAAY